MREAKGFNRTKLILSTMACSLLVFGLILTGMKDNVKAALNEQCNFVI